LPGIGTCAAGRWPSPAAGHPDQPGLALVEYCFAVPANRIGYAGGWSVGQKITLEAIALIVFGVFMVTFLGEPAAVAPPWRLSLPVGGSRLHVRRAVTGGRPDSRKPLCFACRL
jgi:hypothetical protein